ncbi:hypothetical protein BDK51DRAFT_36557 [Blyttiomyces helicus]|uniref:Uncharacterized protein n=1 Tax=Blyttiomyces helicus TaxID=388810 RepID=A0A4V1IQ71_9FUNG|nr:hypothetical protein BDK51DRAFT_36557 [Blyttiomyces helicus]|eukprot:RKO85537.1 hypothetical protein BDK51DRAFT_36557 [Blyttiomyces helicus]
MLQGPDVRIGGRCANLHEAPLKFKVGPADMDPRRRRDRRKGATMDRLDLIGRTDVAYQRVGVRKKPKDQRIQAKGCPLYRIPRGLLSHGDFIGAIGKWGRTLLCLGRSLTNRETPTLCLPLANGTSSLSNVVGDGCACMEDRLPLVGCWPFSHLQRPFHRKQPPLAAPARASSSQPHALHYFPAGMLVPIYHISQESNRRLFEAKSNRKRTMIVINAIPQAKENEQNAESNKTMPSVLENRGNRSYIKKSHLFNHPGWDSATPPLKQHPRLELPLGRRLQPRLVGLESVGPRPGTRGADSIRAGYVDFADEEIKAAGGGRQAGERGYQS